MIEDFLAQIAQEHIQKWLLAKPATMVISLGFGPPIECSGFLFTVKTQSSPFLRPSQRSNDAAMRDFGMIRMNLEAFRMVWDSIVDAYSMRDVYTSFFAGGIDSEYQGSLARMWCKLHQRSKFQTEAKALLSSTRKVLLTTLVLHNGIHVLGSDQESRLVETGPQPRLLNEQLRFALMHVRVDLMNEILRDLDARLATRNWARSPDRLLVIGSFLELTMILEFNAVIDPMSQLLVKQPRAGEDKTSATLDHQFCGILQSLLQTSGIVDFGGIRTLLDDLEDGASQQVGDALLLFIQKNSKCPALI